MANNIIKLNRGDSYEFNIKIHEKNDFSKIYLLDEYTDAVYFALMCPHQAFEKAWLFKGYTAEDQDQETGEITIKIEPNDTRRLTPGVYYYTVKLQRGGTLNVIDDLDEPDEVRTIIERTKFIIND
jgi:hypothetical protein